MRPIYEVSGSIYVSLYVWEVLPGVTVGRVALTHEVRVEAIEAAEGCVFSVHIIQIESYFRPHDQFIVGGYVFLLGGGSTIPQFPRPLSVGKPHPVLVWLELLHLCYVPP